MADHYGEAGNYSEAQKLYREGLSYDDHYSDARIALAQQHLQRGELEACEQECVTLLRTDPDSETASMVRCHV